MIVASLLAAGLSGPAAAQSTKTFVYPPSYGNKIGDAGGWFLGMHPAFLPAHVQMVYPAHEFPFAVGTIHEISFRRASRKPWSQWQVRQYSFRTTVTLGMNPLPPSLLGPDFAANLGKQPVRVFSGKLTWPARPKATGPTPFVARVVFNRPYVFIRRWGRSLVIDGYTPKDGADPKGIGWLMDWVKAGWAQATVNHMQPRKCTDHKGGRPYAYVQHDYGSIGSWFWPELYPLLPNAPGVASIGTQGKGGFWNSWLLPFRVPGTPCDWATDSRIFWPFVVDAKGHARIPPLVIPYDRKLVGVRFCDQHAILDPLANVLGIVPLFSMCRVITNGFHVALWMTSNDTTPPQRLARGGVHGQVAIVRFTYR